MAEPTETPQKQGAWRVIKFILPLVFLFSGFFGVQIWMVMDEQKIGKAEKPVTQNAVENTAKANLAKLSDASAPASSETPIPVSHPQKSSEQASASKIPGMEYYRLQVGSFENTKGAEKLQKKLRAMGYGSLAVNTEGQSKVIVMTVFSQDQSEMLKSALESKGVSGYPEKVSNQDVMILLQNDSKRLQSFMDASLMEVQAMLRELSDHYYIYESQGLNSKEYENLVVSQISRLSDMKTSVENMQVAAEDQVLQGQLKEYLAGYLRYLEKVEKVKKMDRVLLWPGLIERVEAYAQLGMQNKAN